MDTLFPYFQVYPRSFFVDMNAFYAAVEQQECAKYRGKPTIVVPVLTDSTCAIAVSYEARARGIKTGCSVKMARVGNPDLEIVEARPELYLDYHARLVSVLRERFAGIKVLSIDEVTCRVPRALCKTREAEEQLAACVKARIREALGPCLRCSVGIGPNVFLAKVASERQKPDGLTIWDDRNLPEALFPVKVGALPGIGPAMKKRLAAAGIETTQALFEASARDLRRIWGSVVGERWYWMLRGSHDADYQPMQRPEATRKSVGHSNVLAPEYRSREGARTILLELFAKALKRLRAYNQAASAVQVTVRYRTVYGVAALRSPFGGREGVWTRRSRKHLHANDELTWLRVLRPLLDALPDLAPTALPSQVSIVFSELLLVQDVNLNLFEDPPEKLRLGYVLDGLQQKYGESVDLAALHGGRSHLPLRIPYGPPEETNREEAP